MKQRARIVSMVAGATAVSLFTSAARAVDYTWNPTAAGVYDWNNAANWTPAGFPNAAGDSGNLSVGLTGNLDVHLGANFTLGHLTLGGTGAAVTTDVGHGNAGGGTIRFDNTGGVNNSDGTANASITSGGVAGSTNVISAPINLIANTNITTASTNNLTLSGGIVLTSPAGTAVAPTLVANHAGPLHYV